MPSSDRHKPKVVSSIMGLYSPDFISELKARGILWFATATTVTEARAAAAAGADAIVMRRIVDAVNVPVVAAGGIPDARGVAAALILGASAVQIGTGFLRSPKAQIHPVYATHLGHTETPETMTPRLQLRSSADRAICSKPLARQGYGY